MREMSTDRPDKTESPYTVDAGHFQIEWDLFNFERDIYHRRLQVRFLRKLRDEEKYADLPTLIAAIARDVENAKEFFRSRDHQV